MTPERRVDRRDEQSMIAARERAGDRAGGVTAEAVGEPPFAALGLGEIAADLTAEADEARKFCFHRCLLVRTFYTQHRDTEGTEITENTSRRETDPCLSYALAGPFLFISPAFL